MGFGSPGATAGGRPGEDGNGRVGRALLDPALSQACAESAGTVERVLQKARFWMRHSQAGFNARQRKVLNTLLDAGPDGFVGGMTNKKYAHLTHASPATAQRDLAELVALGALHSEGAGRSVRYLLTTVRNP